MPNWIVDDALAQVLKAIQDGSALSIDGVKDDYERRYRPDFKDQWDADPINSWPDAQDRILKLASMVGSLATTLSIYRAIKNGDPITKVDPRSAYLAGHLVANVVCRPSGGVWCMRFDDAAPPPEQWPTRERVDVEFEDFLREAWTLLAI